MPYGEDLAYVHDAGFSDLTRGVAPGLLALLRDRGILAGRIVELACGSGILAVELFRAGYQIVAIDQSPAMLQLARRRSAGPEWRCESLFAAQLPESHAVLCLGEGLTYRRPRVRATRNLEPFFRKVHASLVDEGLFVFDLLQPSLGGRPLRRRVQRQGQDWRVVVDIEQPLGKMFLTRSIRVWRWIDKSWRTTEERHRIELYDTETVKGWLENAGFAVQTRSRIGTYEWPEGRRAFVATRLREATP